MYLIDFRETKRILDIFRKDSEEYERFWIASKDSEKKIMGSLAYSKIRPHSLLQKVDLRQKKNKGYPIGKHSYSTRRAKFSSLKATFEASNQAVSKSRPWRDSSNYDEIQNSLIGFQGFWKFPEHQENIFEDFKNVPKISKILTSFLRFWWDSEETRMNTVIGFCSGSLKIPKAF